MSLSATDSLNIIGYYGEMELSTAEKKVRIVMAEQLQGTVSKYYDTVRAILADDKASKRKKDLLLAAAVLSLKNAYLSLFNKYYPAYINAAGTGSGEPYSAADAWKRRRAYDFALGITQTAQREPNVAFSESHAAAVTRTEVNAVCNLAAMDAAYRQGKRFKTWKTFGDVKVRPSHKAANGQRVPLDMPFTVGGYEMMFPNDSSLGAPAGEVVNCRCVLEFDDGKPLTNSDERDIIRMKTEYHGTQEPSYSELGIEIPKKIKSYLESLTVSGSFIKGNVGDFSMDDLKILSKETKVEFAKVTIGSTSYLIRGTENGTIIPNELVEELRKHGGKWDFHSHPFENDNIPSPADITALKTIQYITGQKTSEIVTTNGLVTVFNEYGVIEVKSLDAIIDNERRKALEELFGGE